MVRKYPCLSNQASTWPSSSTIKWQDARFASSLKNKLNYFLTMKTTNYTESLFRKEYCRHNKEAEGLWPLFVGSFEHDNPFRNAWNCEIPMECVPIGIIIHSQNCIILNENGVKFKKIRHELRWMCIKLRSHADPRYHMTTTMTTQEYSSLYIVSITSPTHIIALHKVK